MIGAGGGERLLRVGKVAIFFIILLLISAGQCGEAATSPATTALGYYAEGISPSRIALDSSGAMYVSDTARGTVYVYSNNGLLLSSLEAPGAPLGIAVDSSGNLMVSDIKRGSVDVYGGDGVLLYSLGGGDGEFGLPNDIAISTGGNVYVTDSIQNLVKVYGPQGESLFSFGGGVLGFPTGVAVDASAGEVFVIDHNNNYVRVYDLNGGLKRSIRGGGGMMGGGKLLRPLGLALDGTRLYVTDSYYSVVAVFDKTTGAFVKYIGNFGSHSGEFKTPTDLVIDADNKMFVTNTNNQRVEALGIDVFQYLRIDPQEVALSAYEDGAAVSADIDILSGSGGAGWTASVGDSWLTLSSYAGTAPAAVRITVDPAGLTPGTYSSEVRFLTSNGMESVAVVRVEIKSQALYVSPSELSLRQQKGAELSPSGSIAITSSSEGVSWVATASASWVRLGSMSGTTPSSVSVGVGDEVKGYEPGLYEAAVFIGAVNGTKGVVEIRVILKVVNAGTLRVTTNIDKALFDITGPASYSGSGTDWINDEAVPGDYTITFRHVSGYQKPPAYEFAVVAGEETALNGAYLLKRQATNLLAGAGGSKGKEVVVLAPEGAPVASFEPFQSADSIRTASGDLDGDGSDEVVLTDGRNRVKIYRSSGDEIAMAEMLGYRAAAVAVGDIDRDGKAEVVVGMLLDDSVGQGKVIKCLGLTPEGLVERVVLARGSGSEPFTLAVGDVNGDGVYELVTADRSEVSAFAVALSSDGDKLAGLWTAPSGSIDMPNVAVGDIDDDGTAEIALSVTQSAGPKETKPVVKVLTGSGEEYGLTIDAFGDLGYSGSSTVALGDIDGDGAEEFGVGAGRDAKNEALYRLYESDGTFTGITVKALDSLFGLNVAFASFTK